MADKSNNSLLGRFSLISNDHNDEENRTNSNNEQQQAIPISIEYLSTPATISNKRRRSSITNEQLLSSELSANNQDFIYDRNLTLTSAIRTCKRSAQDDLDTFTTHSFVQEHPSYV